MINVEFQIPSLFPRVFGIQSRIYSYPGAAGSEQEKNLSGLYKIDNVPTIEERKEVSPITGQALVSPLYFKAGNYKRFDGNGNVIKVDMPELMLPAYVLIEVSREKNLRTTPVNSGVGQVTEMYGFKPWNIKIYGFAYDMESESADDQIIEIQDFEKLTDAIQVYSPFLEVYGIDALSIISVKYPQLKGMPKVRAFQLDCISEQAAELIL